MTRCAGLVPARPAHRTRLKSDESALRPSGKGWSEVRSDGGPSTNLRRNRPSARQFAASTLKCRARLASHALHSLDRSELARHGRWGPIRAGRDLADCELVGEGQAQSSERGPEAAELHTEMTQALLSQSKSSKKSK